MPVNKKVIVQQLFKDRKRENLSEKSKKKKNRRSHKKFLESSTLIVDIQVGLMKNRL